MLTAKAAEKAGLEFQLLRGILPGEANGKIRSHTTTFKHYVEYYKVTSPIVGMIERNISENETLTKRRDELLPLLINGQATVNYHLSVC